MGRPREFLKWAVETFGTIALHRDERAARFVEEAIELAHAEGCSAETVVRIVERVYSRPAGDTLTEIGQAQATLELLAENLGDALKYDLGLLADREFSRVRSIPKEQWSKRHAAKAALGIANLSPNTRGETR